MRMTHSLSARRTFPGFCRSKLNDVPNFAKRLTADLSDRMRQQRLLVEDRMLYIANEYVWQPGERRWMAVQPMLSDTECALLTFGLC